MDDNQKERIKYLANKLVENKKTNKMTSLCYSCQNYIKSKCAAVNKSHINHCDLYLPNDYFNEDKVNLNGQKNNEETRSRWQRRKI